MVAFCCNDLTKVIVEALGVELIVIFEDTSTDISSFGIIHQIVPYGPRSQKLNDAKPENEGEQICSTICN